MMDFLDEGTYLYLGFILLILIVFLWSRNIGKKKRKDQKDRSFRRRYDERRRKR